MKFCPYVVDLEIRGKPKVLTYEKEVTCDIIDNSKAQRLEKIKEDEEDWENDFNDRFDAVQR